MRRLIQRCSSLSAAELLRVLPWSAAAGAGLFLLMLLVERDVQPHRSLVLRQYAEWGVAIATGIAIACRRLPAFTLPKGLDQTSCKAYLWAAHLAMWLLFIPGLLLWKTDFERIHWITYPVLNKRWLIAVYWLAVGSLLLLPHAILRCFEFVNRSESPEPGGAEAVAAPPPPEPGPGEPVRPWASGLRKALPIAAKVAAAALLACLFAGPPWHLDRHHRPIDWHEQVHLGPLQAMYQGYLPYVGPASTQYGPGSQLLTYGLMQWSGHFDIVSYREASAWVHLITTFAFCLVALLALEWWMVFPVLALGLAYSPLHLFQFEADGTLGGFYGWASGFRYLGVLLAVPALPVLLKSRWRDRFPAVPVLALGGLCGLFSWLAQENLAGTVQSAGLLLALLWLTRTAERRAIGKLVLNLAAGFVTFWLPVVTYYALKGVFGEFLRCYFLVPSTVSRGFQNTYWSSGTGDPQYPAFVLMGPLIIVLGVATLCQVRGWRLRIPLDWRQSRFLAFLCVLAACYPASLFRSDSVHLMNTTIALPFVLVLAMADLPAWLASTPVGRWSLRAVVVAITFLVFPLAPLTNGFYAGTIRPTLARFAEPPQSPPPLDSRIPFLRATRFLSDEPPQLADGVPMRVFLEDASALRRIIGGRRTLVQDYPEGSTGLVYFMLDLNPAPFLLNKEMMVINDPLREDALANMKARIREFECMMTEDLSGPEAAVFREAYPAARILEHRIRGRPYYVLLARPDSGNTD